MNTTTWGKLPETLKAECHKKYWGSIAKRRALLRQEITFPLHLSLKIPTGKQAMAQAAHYKQFVDAWRTFRQPEWIQWQTQTLLHFGEQKLPCTLQLPNIEALLHFIGEHKTWQRWQKRLASLHAQLPPQTHNALIHKIEELDTLPEKQLSMLIMVLLQLRPNFGQGLYLRALPLQGAHSKFIEQHFALIEYLAAAIYGDSVREMGLMAWLNCIDTPKDWLLIRPLCPKTRAALANLPLLRLDSATLLTTPLPCQRILVVENDASVVLSLPQLPDTIVVSGGGRNTSWLCATWLPEKQVAYWGDLDAHGLTCLSEARARLPQLVSLMMDTQVIDLFADFITDDIPNTLPEPHYLSATERAAWHYLRQTPQHQRLEQEYLAADFVKEQLAYWLSGSLKNVSATHI